MTATVNSQISGTGVSGPLLTDRAGASQRLRVDPGQTGFFAGRMFRSYTEQVLPAAGSPVSFRFTSPVDFILWSQVLTLTPVSYTHLTLPTSDLV